jgi:hypothetical protein
VAPIVEKLDCMREWAGGELDLVARLFETVDERA